MTTPTGGAPPLPSTPQVVRDLSSFTVSRSPVRMPFPPGFTSVATPESSTKEVFVRRSELRYSIHAPDLIEEVWTSFVDELVKRIPDGDEAKGLSPAAKTMVEGAIRAFESFRLTGYEEASIQYPLRSLFSSLDAVVREVDVIIQFPNKGFIDVLVDAEEPIPKEDSCGREVNVFIKVDLTLYRAQPTRIVDGKEVLPATEDNRAVHTCELKTPEASRDHDSPHPHAGLFVRLVDTAAHRKVLKLEEFSQRHEQSLLKKAIITARTYGHDLFTLEDGYSIIVALLVEHPNGTYDVLLSDLKRVTDPRFFLIHLVPFYSKAFGLAKRFVDFADAAAASYTTEAVPSIPEHPDESSGAAGGSTQTAGARGQGQGASTDAASSQVFSAAAPISQAGQVEGKVATSASVIEGELPAALADLLSDSITIEYPDGTPYSALRFPSPTCSLRSSTSSTGSAPPQLTHSIESISDAHVPLTPFGSLPGTIVPPSAGSADRLDRITLHTFVGQGISARIYTFETAGTKYVLKIALRGAETDIEDEIRLLSGQLRVVERDIVPIEASYVRSDGRPLLFMRYAGVAPECWADVAPEQRSSLVLSLLRIHQRAGVEHGDAGPRNVVVPDNKAVAVAVASSALVPATPRWIDWGHAEQHPHCTGSQCYELADLVRQMRLQDNEVEAIARAAREEGLVW